MELLSDSPFRCGSLPDFVIVGAQKAGTTAAARNLALHPDVEVFSGTTEYGQKEIEFFNQHWERGTEWYVRHFEASSKLRGEKTAELLHRTVCHHRMFLTNPQFKLIVLLRSPVERAYSQWKMAALRKGDEPEDFETVVKRELEFLDDARTRAQFYNCDRQDVSCWREGYVLKGMYAEQLKSLYKWFPKERVLVALSERVRADMARGYADMFEFLGVRPFLGNFVEHFHSPPSEPMLLRARALLLEVYQEANDRLFSMLGFDVPEWS